MSAEHNKALVHRFFEALEDAHRSRAGLQVLDKILAPNFISHTKLLPGQQPDREGYKQAVAELSATSSNARFLIEEQVAQGDKVWTR
ncbi:MAG TPA: ester cyclase, partial [Rubrobacteraceae bacterium]|nr:ester cyclase [Rubrobacteraceae bacterium]